jgi:hypothetical protein
MGQSEKGPCWFGCRGVVDECGRRFLKPGKSQETNPMTEAGMRTGGYVPGV